jgi:UDP-glucose 4-epimerase
VKYLVTGGCGFIGSHLVDALCRAGHSVRILDDLSTGSLAYTPCSVEVIRGDVADLYSVKIAMRDVDGCFHLAAVASVERCNLDWPGTHRTNLAGTVAVFDAARKRSTPVVYASSAAVYGNNPDVLTEDAVPRPISAYGADKLGCELHGSVAHRVHRVPNCGLRFFNVYGPRQDPNSPYSGVITIFSNRIRTVSRLSLMVMVIVAEISFMSATLLGRCWWRWVIATLIIPARSLTLVRVLKPTLSAWPIKLVLY